MDVKVSGQRFYLTLFFFDKAGSPNFTKGNINVNDGSRNPVLIPDKKKQRKTSTEIAAEMGTWKQEVTLLKGLKPTDIKDNLPTRHIICHKFVIFDGVLDRSFEILL